MTVQPAAAQLFAQALHDMLTLLLVSVRMLVAFEFIPILGTSALLGMVRLCIGLSLACLLVPAVRGQWSAAATPEVFLLVVAKEGFLGLLLGFVAGSIFSVMNAVGKILDQQVGSTQSAVHDPTVSQPGGATSQFLVQLTATAVLCSGAFLIMVGGLYESYGVWPVWSWWPHLEPSYVSVMAAEFGQQTDLALRLSLPFLTLMLVIEIGIGVLARAVPSLDCNAFAMSLKHLCVQWLLLILCSALIARCIALVSSPAFHKLFELFH